MNVFSKRSQDNLASCHKDLQTLFSAVLPKMDITVIEGHRTVERQQELFAQGRTKPGNIVTYIDGVNRKGKHNLNPSLAVDVVPFPIDWNDIERFKNLNNIVVDTWTYLKSQGKVHNKLIWGGDWNRFKDYPHYELEIVNYIGNLDPKTEKRI